MEVIKTKVFNVEFKYTHTTPKINYLGVVVGTTYTYNFDKAYHEGIEEQVSLPKVGIAYSNVPLKDLDKDFKVIVKSADGRYQNFKVRDLSISN